MKTDPIELDLSGVGIRLQGLPPDCRRRFASDWGPYVADGPIDAVIDPVDSRSWIMSALRAAPKPGRRHRKKRPYIDPW